MLVARVGWTERSEVQHPLASMLEFASLTPTYTGFGYRSPDGTVVVNGEPIEVEIME